MTDAASLNAFTVVKLKEMLRANKLPVSGRKAVLVQRLANHYQAQSGAPVNNLPPKPAPEKKKKTPKIKSPKQSFTFDSNNTGTQNIQQKANANTVAFNFQQENTITFEPNIISTPNISQEQTEPNFILPIVGSQDKVKAIQDLFEQGFITFCEYKKRINDISTKDSFFTSTLCNEMEKLSLPSADGNTISVKDYKEWSKAIKLLDEIRIRQLLKRLISAISAMKESSLRDQEQYVRICSMIKKMDTQVAKKLKDSDMNPLLVTLTKILANFSEECWIVQTLLAMGCIATTNYTRNELLQGNIGRILEIGELQLSINKPYSLEVTAAVCSFIKCVLQSFNVSLMSADQHDRAISMLLRICKEYKQTHILANSLGSFRAICYKEDVLNRALTKPYFLETIFAHLSNSDLRVVAAAVLALCNVSSHSDDIIDKVIQLGTVEQFIHLLRHNFSNDSADARTLIKEIYFCLSNFIAGTKAQTEYTLDRGIISLLIKQYPSAAIEIRQEMIWVFGNFLQSPVDISYFDDEKIFFLAYEMLQSPEYKDSEIEHLQKSIRHVAKNHLPKLGFDHPDIASMLELLH